MLDLQAVDSTLDQLDHRLQTLPEHVALVELSARRNDVDRQVGETQTAVADLARDQRKAEADVEQVRARRVRNRARLDAGLVSDPKQIQAMQHEVETLERRISTLEDEELEVMERLDDAQHRLTALRGELVGIDADIASQTATRDTAAGQIAASRRDASGERDKLADVIPADLLSLYTKLRTQLGGVGAGELKQKRCGGCRLEIGSAELARFAAAAPDEVLRCEECNRILVRTAQSGV